MKKEEILLQAIGMLPDEIIMESVTEELLEGAVNIEKEEKKVRKKAKKEERKGRKENRKEGSPRKTTSSSTPLSFQEAWQDSSIQEA